MNLDTTSPYSSLRAFCGFTAAMMFILIVVGGITHSSGAGLAIPDWPTAFGKNMFLLPPAQWAGSVVLDHGHRIFAAFVGLLTIIQFVWIRIAIDNPRQQWLRNLSLATFAFVCLQGLLGGLAVQYGLPAELGVLHSILAHIVLVCAVATFLCVPVTAVKKSATTVSPAILYLAGGVTALTLLQILLGSFARHTFSFVADFPLINNAIIPHFATFDAAMHFAIRACAVLLTITALGFYVKVARSGAQLRPLRRYTMPLALCVGVQNILGAIVVLSGKALLPSVVHAALGAVLLMVAFTALWRSLEWYTFESIPSFSINPGGNEVV